MRRASLLGLAALTLAGCGSSTETVSSPATVVVPGAVQQTVNGRAVLDVPFQNATVTILAPDGTPLSLPVTTDSAGQFRAAVNTSGPFRAVATRGSESYASEYATFDPATEQVMITPLTNLVATYHEAHPERDLVASEAAVRNYLRLPSTQDVRFHWVTNAHRPGFHVPRYLQRARGAQDFARQVVASIDAPIPQIPNSVFSDDQKMYWEQEGLQLGVAVVTTILQANGIPFGALVGWAVNFLDGQAGGGQMGQLAAAIEALAREIEAVYRALARDLNRLDLEVDVALTNSVKASVDTTEGTYLTKLRQGGSVADLQTFAASLTTGDFVGQSASLHEALVADNGILHGFAKLYGLADLEYRSNRTTFNPMSDVFTFYASYQTRLIRLIVEGFHGSAIPVPMQAQTFFDNYARYLADEATYIPQPLDSDDVIYVPRAGLIFNRVLQPYQDYASAQQLASTFRDGNYRKWRVATRQDMFGLLQPRGQGTSKTKQSELQRLGFNLDAAQDQDNNTLHASSYRVGVQDPKIERRFMYLDDPDYDGEDIYGRWSFYDPQCYFLVCDAKDQDPTVLPALTELTSLKVTQEGGQLRALATVRGSDSVRSGSGHYGNFTKEELDYSQLVSWKSDDFTTLRVQNPPAGGNVTTTADYQPPVPLGPGFLTWYKPSSGLNVTALGNNPYAADVKAVSAHLTVSNSTVPPAALQKLLLAPQGLVLNQAPTSTNLTLVGFFADGSSRYLGANVTFTASIPQARVIYEPLQAQLLLQLTGSTTASNFLVTAAVNGVQSPPLNVTVALP